MEEKPVITKLAVPVLFLVFNRPETTARVFDAIREARPTKLYVAADGPRPTKEGEADNCHKVREIVTQVDWPCEVQTLFRDSNLGCEKAVSEAIDWFFKEVEEGIILEDDCLPDASFFHFCSDLLDYYRHNDKVMMISGDNFQLGRQRGDASYYFSAYPHIWGWATWRRAWQKYDVRIPGLQEYIKQGKIQELTANSQERNFWLKIFTDAQQGSTGTWDYQWVFTVFNNSGLCIMPNVNLVKNLGLAGGTNTIYKAAEIESIPVGSIVDIEHPPVVERDTAADKFTAENFFPISPSGQTTLGRVKRKILNILKKYIA